MTTTGKIFTAIPAIISEVGPVGKNSVNQQQRYKYRSADDICDALHDALGKHKVFTTCEISERQMTERLSKNGGVLFYVDLKAKYTFHGEDGSSVSTDAWGEAMDSADKATNKAMTAAYKYALLQVFCLMGHDDGDEETPEPAPRSEGYRSEEPRQSAPRGDMPTCPNCNKNTGVIKGKEEYGGGWVCFAKKGGCGHKWQTVQDLAQQTGMTTGDKIEQPKNGKHAELSADEMESYGKYQRYFAAAWTEGAYRKFCDMLSGEASQSLKAKLKIAMDDAQLRTELLTQESIDDATMDAIGVWMTKTPDIRDLERWMGEFMECDPCPFSENQKAKLVRWFGKE